VSADETQLPIFKHIDTSIGLKYLNNNYDLYLKVLDNFLERYRRVQLSTLENGALHDVIHAIKGLSSTLGMYTLEKITTQIHQQLHPSREIIQECSNALQNVLDELKQQLRITQTESISSILIINNNPDEIDELIEILDDDFDILLALNKYEALEIFDEEQIDLVILHTELHDLCGIDIFNFLKKHTNIEKIPLIFITKKENEQKIKEIYPLQNIAFIYKPFQKAKIKEQIIIFNNL
jgi:PleD family two-component response regulator